MVIFETKFVTLMLDIRGNMYRGINFDHFGVVLGARNWVPCFEVISPQSFINAHLRKQEETPYPPTHVIKEVALFGITCDNSKTSTLRHS